MLDSVENSIASLNPAYHHNINNICSNKKLIMSSSVSRRSHTPTCESIGSQHRNDSPVATPTRTSSLDDQCIKLTKDTPTTEQLLYTRLSQRHHHESSPQLTSLQVRLDVEEDDEHDENSDSAFYHAHKHHHHHLPLTPPIVSLPSPCTPLSEPTSSPAPSSPPASPLASSDITLTSVAVTPVTHISPPLSHSPAAASDVTTSNCVPTSPPKVPSPSSSHSASPTTTKASSPTIESTATATVILQSEPLGEFKRAGSTRRSQRFRPYGSDRSRSRPKAAPEVTPVKSNAHLCDITPLTVDTDLANGQSALAQRSRVAARQSAKQVSEQILSVMRENRFDSLTQILSASKPLDLNVFVDGQTLLHHCLLLDRDVSWCKELVMAGANPNLSNREGWHPLHLAAFRGATETLNYLVSCNNNNNPNSRHHSASTTLASSLSSSSSSSSS